MSHHQEPAAGKFRSIMASLRGRRCLVTLAGASFFTVLTFVVMTDDIRLLLAKDACHGEGCNSIAAAKPVIRKPHSVAATEQFDQQQMSPAHTERTRNRINPSHEAATAVDRSGQKQPPANFKNQGSALYHGAMPQKPLPTIPDVDEPVQDAAEEEQWVHLMADLKLPENNAHTTLKAEANKAPEQPTKQPATSADDTLAPMVKKNSIGDTNRPFGDLGNPNPPLGSIVDGNPLVGTDDANGLLEKTSPVLLSQNRVAKHDYNSALLRAKVALLEEWSEKKLEDLVEEQRKAWSSKDNANSKGMVAKRKQIVVATTWRSGSTFLEEMLTSHPGMFNHYEPLLGYGIRQIRDQPSIKQAVSLLSDLLKCDYSRINNYLEYASTVPEMFQRNTRLQKTCERALDSKNLCYDAQFLRSVCQLYPYQTMKVVRLRLRDFEPLLLDPALNVHLVYLIRDPRGTMNSRRTTVEWCKGSDCDDPVTMCKDLSKDYEDLFRMVKLHPGRITVLRYEDLAMNPEQKAVEFLNEVGLRFDNHIKEFIETHTKGDLDVPWTTTRVSSSRIARWLSSISRFDIEKIQRYCKKVLGGYGYVPVDYDAGREGVETYRTSWSLRP